MKKTIFLLLTLVLCVSLSACGVTGENTSIEPTFETITDVQTDHPLLQEFICEWEYRGDYAQSYPFSKLEVNQDGTCLADGQAAAWKISDRTSDDNLYIDILIDAEAIGTICFYDWNDQISFSFPELPFNPGDQWVNVAAEEAAINELLASWSDVLYGQWEVFHRDDVGKIDPVIVCDDGTVKIGDQTYTWELGENWSYLTNELDIMILDGATMLYEMKLWWEEGDIHGQLKDTNNDYIILYKPSYYEILTITVDNIYDYFEMINTWQEERNGFGEVTDVRMWSEFVLKEPYASRVSYVNHRAGVEPVVDRGAIEWRYQQGSFDILLNDDHTFTLENCVSKSEKTEISGGDGFTRSSYRFEVPRTSGWYQPGEDLDVEQWRAHNDNGYFDFEVVRVQVAIYLIPEE
jgi:hypothetical protein